METAKLQLPLRADLVWARHPCASSCRARARARPTLTVSVLGTTIAAVVVVLDGLVAREEQARLVPTNGATQLAVSTLALFLHRHLTNVCHNSQGLVRLLAQLATMTSVLPAPLQTTSLSAGKWPLSNLAVCPIAPNLTTPCLTPKADWFVLWPSCLMTGVPHLVPPANLPTPRAWPTPIEIALYLTSMSALTARGRATGVERLSWPPIEWGASHRPRWDGT